MDIHEEKGYIVLSMYPSVTKESVLSLSSRLDPYLQESGKEYVVDMTAVKTLNSSMASLIVHIIRHVEQAKSKLCLVNVEPNVQSALESLHLTSLTKTYESALDFEIDRGVEIKSISH